jgi:hypothetical protein
MRKIFKYKIPFGSFCEVIEVVHDILMLYFFVKLILAFLLIIEIADLDGYEPLGENVFTLVNFSRKAFPNPLKYLISLLQKTFQGSFLFVPSLLDNFPKLL